MRDKLSRETKGQAVIEFPSHSTAQDLLNMLQINTIVKASVNDMLLRDLQCELQDEDKVSFFLLIGNG